MRADGAVEELATKQINIPLRTGDRFVLATSGGGGLGARDDAMAMQFLKPNWKFDPKRPCLC